MYKVFVNEKRLSLSNSAIIAEKSIAYENKYTLEMAVDLLENTSASEINIYHENLSEMWADFCSLYRVIEAAGGVVKNPNSEYLFIKRLGKWDLPKGKIEKGESLREAAIREIEEETGLSHVEIEDFLATTYHIYTERNGEKVLKTTHWFSMKTEGNQKLIPQEEEGIMAAVWKNKSDIILSVYGQTFKNIELILHEHVNI